MTGLFDFILVMVSLLLAIGVTHLVQGVAGLVRLRGRVRLAPVPLVWAVSLFIVAAIYWWSLWDLREADWRFPVFFYMLLAPTLLHIAASLLVPGTAVEAGSSLQAEFDRIRVPFMVTMAAFSVIVTWDGWVAGTEPAWTPYRPVQIWTIGLYVAGAALGGERPQRLIAGLVLTTYVVAGFFFRFLPGAFGA